MPAGVKVSDHVSLGVVAVAVPRDVIDDAVTAHGVGAKRLDGKLPAHVTAYATMGLCLFPDDDYTEVLTKVTGALTSFGCWDEAWSVPSASALTQARKRLGPEVFETIFERVAGPVATPFTRGAWLGNPHHAGLVPHRRLVAIDGFDVDVPDTADNAAQFGYAGAVSAGAVSAGAVSAGAVSTGSTSAPGAAGRSAFPKARVVVLAECGTHALLAAEVDAYAVGEKTLAARLYPRLAADEVLLADRGFYSFTAWREAQAAGADLIWRAPTQLRLPALKALPDGSYLSVLIDPDVRAHARQVLLDAARVAVNNEADGGECVQIPDVQIGGVDVRRAHLVRVVDYTVPDRVGNGSGELITLITTITDPDDVAAEDLAAAYAQRWEEESTFDELKTHLRGPGRVLRSKLADLVRQEIWAWLTLHHALALLRSRAAEAAAIDPDRISYTHLLRIVRRTATGTADFPP